MANDYGMRHDQTHPPPKESCIFRQPRNRTEKKNSMSAHTTVVAVSQYHTSSTCSMSCIGADMKRTINTYYDTARVQAVQHRPHFRKGWSSTISVYAAILGSLPAVDHVIIMLRGTINWYY